MNEVSVHTKIEGGLFWHYTLHPRIKHHSLLHISWDDSHPCRREWSMEWVKVSESDRDGALLPSVSPRMPLGCPHLPSPVSLALSPHVIRKKGWRVMAFISSVGLALLLSLTCTYNSRGAALKQLHGKFNLPCMPGKSLQYINGACIWGTDMVVWPVAVHFLMYAWMVRYFGLIRLMLM